MVANDAEIAQPIAQWTIVVTTPIGAGLGWSQVGPPIRQPGAPIPALIDAEQSQQEHDYNDDEQQAYKVVRGAATTAQRASIIAAATAYQQNDDNYKQYCHRWTASVDASVNIAALLCSER